MFFKFQDTKKTLSTITPDKVVYLLSYSPQSLYLFYHFQNNGYFPIILETPDKIVEMEKDDYVLKEDRLLQRTKFKLQTAYQMQHEGELLIIPQTTSSLKNKIPLLSPAKLKKAQIIFLDFDEDISPFVDFMQKQIIRGTMNCFIELTKKQITLSGRQPTITLSCEEDHPAVRILRTSLSNEGINIDTLPNAEKNFWSAFIPYTAASLLSAATEKSIATMTKDPDNRQIISDIINELVALALKNNIDISASEMLRKIYNIPYSYTYPLQQDPKNQYELNRLFSILTKRNKTDEKKIPLLRNLFKQIYNKTLA